MTNTKPQQQNTFRSAHRAWSKQTFGDFNFTIAMLRHGFRITKALTGVLQELHAARADAKKVNTRITRPDLANAAYEARRKFKLAEWRRRQRTPAYRAKSSGDYIEVSWRPYACAEHTTVFAQFLIETVVCSFSAQVGSMLYHRDHHIVISRGGVTEAVQKAPPPCRWYSHGHHVAKTLCTILRRAKRKALFNVCRKYANSRLSRSAANRSRRF